MLHLASAIRRSGYIIADEIAAISDNLSKFRGSAYTKAGVVRAIERPTFSFSGPFPLTLPSPFPPSPFALHCVLSIYIVFCLSRFSCNVGIVPLCYFCSIFLYNDSLVYPCPSPPSFTFPLSFLKYIFLALSLSAPILYVLRKLQIQKLKCSGLFLSL